MRMVLKRCEKCGTFNPKFGFCIGTDCPVCKQKLKQKRLFEG